MPDLQITPWEDFAVGGGLFTLRLPPGAYEPRVQCIDSACGLVDLPGWRLHYDMGTLAGPGDTLVPPRAAESATTCTEVIAGRRVVMQTYRQGRDPGVPREHYGELVGRATLRVAEGEFRGQPVYSGLYLSVSTDSPQHLLQFLAAVRTLQLPRRAPGG